MPSLYTQAMGMLVVGGSLVAPGVAAAEMPEHLVWAEELVDTINPSANYYGDPAKMTWSGENGLGYSTHRAKCGSFVTGVLERAYDDDFVAWFGCTSPHAASYHDAIEDEDGFTRIDSIDDVEEGDIVAIRYFDAGCTAVTCGGQQGCTSTGHAALVAAAPTPRVATAPLVAGTLQYTLQILDSTSSPHGPSDTRWEAGPGTDHDLGAGRGTMRVYVDASDSNRPIVGYTWSTSSGSTYYSHTKRALVIGRYTP